MGLKFGVLGSAALVAMAIFISGPVVGEDTYRYRIRSDALKCLKESEDVVRGAAGEPITIDISTCPPTTSSDFSSIFDIQNSLGLDIPGFSGDDVASDEPDSLLIVNRSELDCFYGIILDNYQSSEAVVNLDFSECLQK